MSRSGDGARCGKARLLTGRNDFDYCILTELRSGKSIPRIALTRRSVVGQAAPFLGSKVYRLVERALMHWDSVEVD